MRSYLDILTDIEKHMADNQLFNDLESLYDWQKKYNEEADFCSGTATWLYTFQVCTTYNAALFDLIDEFGGYCIAKGSHFV